jgi:hypothetical protein
MEIEIGDGSFPDPFLLREVNDGKMRAFERDAPPFPPNAVMPTVSDAASQPTQTGSTTGYFPAWRGDRLHLHFGISALAAHPEFA